MTGRATPITLMPISSSATAISIRAGGSCSPPRRAARSAFATAGSRKPTSLSNARGFDERIDKRSLKDQGIDREPQIHVGAGAEKLREKQYEFRSAEKEVTRLIDGVPTTVTVNYPVIDEGKTRFQENEERIQRNMERAQTLAGIAVEHEKLDAYYSEATAALKAVPGETPWTEDDRLRHIHAAIRGFNTSQQDDSDPLTSIIGEHLAARTREQIENDKIFWFRGRAA